jgi:radical SAM superfamily enzyme YgiQ (UPF0313 family)
MKKFLLVNYSPATSNDGSQEVPYLWMTLHSYFKRNSVNPNAWEWLEPIYSPLAETPEELVDKIVSQTPDVIGISCYIWNSSLTFWVAEQVKLKLPNVKIIAGGPSLNYWKHQDWFKIYWYIDLVCNYNGYGEPFITSYLDGASVKEIPYAIYPDLGRHVWNESTAKITVKEFKWPAPYKDNIEYLKQFKIKHPDVKGIVDTSRGCPYACVFCEWGGGTSTKVAFRPLVDTLEELEIMFSILQPKYVDINNANFGVIKEDLVCAEKICELQEKYKCVQDVNVYGPTKSNKLRLKQILNLFAKVGIIQDMKLSVQSTNKQILDNIKRVDMTYSDQKDLFISVAEENNIQLKFEGILGLPGETVETFYQTISDLVDDQTHPMMYEWIMLDSSPAAREPYFSEMGIVTKEVKFRRNAYLNHTKPKKDEAIGDVGYRNILHDTVFANIEAPRYVVGTYSYNSVDWVEMKMARHVFYTLYKTHLIQPYIRHLRSIGVPINEFFKRSFRGFFLRIPQVKIAHDVMLKQVQSDELLDPYYVSIADNLPYFSYYSTIKFAILLDPKMFFKLFGEWLVSAYGDTHFIDISNAIGNAVQTPMYSEMPPREKISSIIAMCEMVELPLV